MTVSVRLSRLVAAQVRFARARFLRRQRSQISNHVLAAQLVRDGKRHRNTGHHPLRTAQPRLSVAVFQIRPECASAGV